MASSNAILLAYKDNVYDGYIIAGSLFVALTSSGKYFMYSDDDILILLKYKLIKVRMWQWEQEHNLIQYRTDMFDKGDHLFNFVEE